MISMKLSTFFCVSSAEALTITSKSLKAPEKQISEMMTDEEKIEYVVQWVTLKEGERFFDDTDYPWRSYKNVQELYNNDDVDFHRRLSIFFNYAKYDKVKGCYVEFKDDFVKEVINGLVELESLMEKHNGDLTKVETTVFMKQLFEYSQKYHYQYRRNADKKALKRSAQVENKIQEKEKEDDTHQLQKQAVTDNKLKDIDRHSMETDTDLAKQQNNARNSGKECRPSERSRNLCLLVAAFLLTACLFITLLQGVSFFCVELDESYRFSSFDESVHGNGSLIGILCGVIGFLIIGCLCYADFAVLIIGCYKKQQKTE